MKSLFKRTLAAASGSVLALTQLAAMAVNVDISAAETASTSSATEIDKAFVLNVPVVEKDPFQITASDWNDKAESKLMAAGKKQFAAHAQELRTKFINRLDAIFFYGGSVTKDQASRFAECFSDINVTVNEDGTFEAVVEMYDAAQVTTEIYMDTLARAMGKDTVCADDGTPITPDFSGVKIAGKFIITGTTDFANKTIKTTAKFVDENGKEYTDADSIFEVDGYCQHQMNTISLAAYTAGLAANEAGHTTDKYDEKVQEIAKHGANFNDDVLKAANAVQSIKVEGTDRNQVYVDYLNEVGKKMFAAKISDRNKERITNQMIKYIPINADAAFKDTLVNHYYNSAVNFFNTKYENIQITLQPTDIGAVLDEAISEEYAFTNGYSFNAKVKIEDDQEDELLAELIASTITAKQIEDDYGYTVVVDGDATGIDYADRNTYEYVSVESVKTIFFSDTTNDYGFNTEFFYDVLRDVQEVHIKAKTVTTTTTTKEIIETTTTTSDKGQDVTTTTTAEPQPGGSTTTTTAEPQPGGSTTTTTAEPQPGGSTTTTTAEPQPGGSTTTTTAEPQPGGSTTTTTGIEPIETTTTTLATLVSFDIQGVDDEGLVYWSEETTPFDLSKLSVTLRIYEAGVDTGKTADVTGAFEATAKDPTQCEKPDGIGIAATPVAFKLVDAAAVQKAVLDAGYDQATIDENGLVEGKEVGNLIVYLVNRGDTDLDGEIGVRDAQYTLVYYTATLVSGKTAKEIIDDPDEFYLTNKADKALEYLPFSHYAADAANGDGKITVQDAQAILSYWTYWKVAKHDGEWTWKDIDEIPVQGHTPLDKLHAKPLSEDTYCADVPDLFDKSLADN